MADNTTIQKDIQVSASQDYNLLRAKGMEYIQELGSKLWTDYNIHDPGITLLEVLCYAITDLGYRTAFDIKDLLASPIGVTPDPDKQALFTARNILTVNPWIIADYRKLLIDIKGVKNAWLFCKDSGASCGGMKLYANCQKSILQYSPCTAHVINIKGFYDVLIEFEDEEGVGDLNSGKIKYNFNYLSTDVVPRVLTAAIEMRLPSWQTINQDSAKYKSFINPLSEVMQVNVSFITGNSTQPVNVPDGDDFWKALRQPLYTTLQIVFAPDKSNLTLTETLQLDLIAFTVWFQSDADRKMLTVNDLSLAIQDATASGIIAKYLDKIKTADAVMDDTKYTLQQHRNLCEDFCSVTAVQVEDIGICADMDVTSDADIEQVLAQAYYLIDQYFSPDIKFYSLAELLNNGKTVDDIFDGPQLDNGFIDNDQLDATQLKTVLHTSDIINFLMDIPGVIAIRNLVLTRYNAVGKLVESEPWTMTVTTNMQPRLYLEASKFLVFKNGLPFLPDSSELADTLQVIIGANAQPQYSIIENDLPVPTGTYYQLDQYQAVQNALPLTYGVGFEGLPRNASDQRQAQARQLKAYLMVYEQILVDYLQQLSHIKDLFSLDESVSRTYFTQFITDSTVNGVGDLLGKIKGYPAGQTDLDALVEDQETYLDRRNRFLNHLMARFGEQFTDYALMLYSYTDTKKVADEELITDKIKFMQELPFMSSNRARSFNYKDAADVCSDTNIPGLQTRIARLLGFKQISNHFKLYEEFDTDGKVYERRWRLVDDNGKIYISGSTHYVNEDMETAGAKANLEIEQVIKYITDESRYTIKKNKVWTVDLTDPTGEIIATRKQGFITEDAAKVARQQIIDFAKTIIYAEKIYVVEHLLLRPRNMPDADLPNGDPLLPVCVANNCDLCGEEDPYSFRLTIVLNGEVGIANAGIAFRRFAETTIRQEVPAHLALKICWISNAQMEIFQGLYCTWLTELAKTEPDKILLSQKLTDLLAEFIKLKSVYPKAYLHDCVDGNDENRVYLNQTIV
jgi:hypothetical protein